MQTLTQGSGSSLGNPLIEEKLRMDSCSSNINLILKYKVTTANI